MSDTAHGGTGSPYKIYWITWGILLVITVSMLAAEAFHLPRIFTVLFLLAFMMVKAAMIGGNFMHLRFERRNLTWVVTLGILVVLIRSVPALQHLLKGDARVLHGRAREALRRIQGSD